MKYLSASTSLVSNEPVEDDSFSISDENIDSRDNRFTIENTQPEIGVSCITSKLVAAYCQLNMRDCVYSSSYY